MDLTPQHPRTQRWASALLVLAVLGLLLRLTIKDRLAGLAVVFYALAPLVVVMVGIMSCALYARLPARPWATVARVVLLVAVAVWIRTDYVFAARPARADGGFRVALWNVGTLFGTADDFVPMLQGTNAEIILLVESGGHGPRHRRYWQAHFPDYQVVLLPGGVALLSRYPVSRAALHRMGWQTRIAVYDLGMLSVVGVDIESDPLVRRKPFIDRAHAIAAAKPGPVIVLGDFNTPHTSALFGPFRQSFQHAFEEAGTGLVPTWPVFCPVLALDHIWLSRQLVPVRAAHRAVLCCDHALVVADMRLRPENDSYANRTHSTHDEER